MSDTESSRRARVKRVVAAGRRIASPLDRLGQEARQRLPLISGLSSAGIELALTEHLETSVSEDDLRALLASTSSASRCQLVLSANVCTAALRAIAVATATSPDVLARPSRRDPVVAELIVRALQDDPEFRGTVKLVESADLPGRSGDELHIYGADATIAQLRSQVGPGVVVRGHGTGMGVVVVGASEDRVGAARAIATDVVPFDQRGCLSPRVVLVEGAVEEARELAVALHEALVCAGRSVPRGALDDAVRAELARHRAILQTLGSWWEGAEHAVGLDPSPRALLLPPAARIVHVVPVTRDILDPLLDPWCNVITALGEQGRSQLVEAVRRRLPHARRSALGRMQRPPLDGPVDLRPR
ncbi:acyl-CoA reductase [Chondromyces crocatus]|uniref:Proline dehydrogenase n=1 Tax=Chondromyces crocatus TaxID=52 RepID=A0A0K1E540_CHOCO|nr:acyl-CoA reductase [Chondromyces crocatus]AKT35996.1 proline dehydrogenase [Chondromyces crocatus]